MTFVVQCLSPLFYLYIFDPSPTSPRLMMYSKTRELRFPSILESKNLFSYILNLDVTSCSSPSTVKVTFYNHRYNILFGEKFKFMSRRILILNCSC